MGDADVTVVLLCDQLLLRLCIDEPSLWRAAFHAYSLKLTRDTGLAEKVDIGGPNVLRIDHVSVALAIGNRAWWSWLTVRTCLFGGTYVQFQGVMHLSVPPL